MHALHVKILYLDTPQSIEIELHGLAKAIGAEWPNLAICLGLSAVDVEVIKADVKTTVEQAYKMLIDWYWDNGSQVTIADVAMTVAALQSEKTSTAESGIDRNSELRVIMLQTACLVWYRDDISSWSVGRSTISWPRSRTSRFEIYVLG